jgi:DNA-binding Lrp family transcriptional regulator
VTHDLFTNHGKVLLTLARQPTARIRDLAEAVGITERAAQAIVNDLVAAGYLERTREGRRNRYLVRGDRPLRGHATGPHEVGDLLHAFVRESSAGPERGPRRAVVLACSDHRFQQPLRNLLAAEGLLARAEVFLWPGGSAALGGPDGPRIVEAMVRAVGTESPPRVVLVAHQGCHARGARVARRDDPVGTSRAVLQRRRRGIDRARRTFGVEPELWFLTERGAKRVRAPAPARGRG